MQFTTKLYELNGGCRLEISICIHTRVYSAYVNICLFVNICTFALIYIYIYITYYKKKNIYIYTYINIPASSNRKPKHSCFYSGQLHRCVILEKSIQLMSAPDLRNQPGGPPGDVPSFNFRPSQFSLQLFPSPLHLGHEKRKNWKWLSRWELQTLENFMLPSRELTVSHLWNMKIIFKMPWWGICDPSQEGILET